MLTYSELVTFDTFEARLAYLSVIRPASEMVFESLRVLNQNFYKSLLWRDLRNEVIARDFGFDLGIPGKIIHGKVLIHHMNPLEPRDLVLRTNRLLNPEYLITTSHKTHQAIHYGIPIENAFVERTQGDTKLW